MGNKYFTLPVMLSATKKVGNSINAKTKSSRKKPSKKKNARKTMLSNQSDFDKLQMFFRFYKLCEKFCFRFRAIEIRTQ